MCVCVRVHVRDAIERERGREGDLGLQLRRLQSATLNNRV